MDESQALESLRARIRAFAKERDWEQFHTPKNLAMAMIVEAAELVEHFQWLTADQSQDLPPKTRARVREEIADVLIYLVRLADVLEIDPLQAAFDKITLNALKYPVEKSRGHNTKYTELE
jgi:NTP pyrophosphatase (non-canonical NTP hydrolase)